MTTDELKQKIIDKAAEMLESEMSCEELNHLASAYNQITANDTMDSIKEILTKNTEPFFKTPNLPQESTCENKS